MIVRGIDPQHRNARALAEGAKGVDQPLRPANLVALRRTAAAGKADRGDETRRRIGGESDGGKAARRNADGDHARRIDVRPVRDEFERGFEVGGAGGARRRRNSGCRNCRRLRPSRRRSRHSRGASRSPPPSRGGQIPAPAAASRAASYWHGRPASAASRARAAPADSGPVRSGEQTGLRARRDRRQEERATAAGQKDSSRVCGACAAKQQADDQKDTRHVVCSRPTGLCRRQIAAANAARR